MVGYVSEKYTSTDDRAIRALSEARFSPKAGCDEKRDAMKILKS